MNKSIKFKKKQGLKKKQNIGKKDDMHHFHLFITLGSLMYVVGLFLPFSTVSSERHFTYFQILLFGHVYLLLMSFIFIYSIYGFIKKKKSWKIYFVFTFVSVAEPLALSMNLWSNALRFGAGFYLTIIGANIAMFGAGGIMFCEKMKTDIPSGPVR